MLSPGVLALFCLRNHQFTNHLSFKNTPKTFSIYPNYYFKGFGLLNRIKINTTYESKAQIPKQTSFLPMQFANSMAFPDNFSV